MPSVAFRRATDRIAGSGGDGFGRAAEQCCERYDRRHREDKQQRMRLRSYDLDRRAVLARAPAATATDCVEFPGPALSLEMQFPRELRIAAQATAGPWLCMDYAIGSCIAPQHDNSASARFVHDLGHFCIFADRRIT